MSPVDKKMRPDSPKSTPHFKGSEPRLEPSRREFLSGLGGAAIVTALSQTRAFAQAPESALNIARVAIPTSRYMMSENKISALNDGFTPENSFDRAHALYALWAERSSDNPAS